MLGGEEVIGKPLYLWLNFAVNLKELKKQSSKTRMGEKRLKWR